MTADASARLTQTSIAQPALFVVEYALARLWMSWGVQPEACLGHSIGEYVAACLAGVFSLKDALRLVALRGKLMQEMPEGLMLAVPLPEARVRRLIGDGLWLAAVNAPTLCVLSGTAAAIDAVEEKLQREGVQCQRLQTSHAFHSGLMDGAVAPLVAAFAGVTLHTPKLPYISNVTGEWIQETQAKDPKYWGRQLREAVLFAAGAAELLKADNRAFLEVGPGYALSTLVRRQAGARGARDVFSSLRHPQEQTADAVTMLLALGRLWLDGVAIDWQAFYENERRSRVPLPTYPFEKQRFWVPRGTARPAARRDRAAGRTAHVDDWFYAPAWTQAVLPMRAGGDASARTDGCVVVFVDECGVGRRIVERFEQNARDVVTVRAGERYRPADARSYTIDPGSREDYERLIGDLITQGRWPAAVINAWGVNPAADAGDGIRYGAHEEGLFRSVLLLAQALGQADISTQVRVGVVTTGVHDVNGVEPLSPGKAMVLGLCHVIPQEYPNLSCKAIDLGDLDVLLSGDAHALDQLLHDLVVDATSPVVAYRGTRRWAQTFRSLHLPAPAEVPARLRPKGVYLITGGLGDIALNFGEYFARTVGARLVLTARTPLPPEAEWDRYLAANADVMAERIVRIRRIRSLGGEVLIVAADVADPRQMEEAFASAERRFGRIDGVIHAAGLISADAFTSISETDDEICGRQFQPKVAGLEVVDGLVAGRDLDFVMLVSSLSAVLGGLRYAAYASANAFLDAAAQKRSRTSRVPWLTVNWDAWMRAKEEALLKESGGSASGFVMTGSEGVEALRRILSTDAGVQVIVSTGDLQTRVEQWLTVSGADARSADAGDAVVKLPRPNLQTEFVAPDDELERSIATIWQDLLCVERVGVNDNFFELGGDSLLGIQVIARLKKELGVKVSAVTLYEGPRVGLLAEIIRGSERAQQPAAVDGSRERGERRRERKLRHDAAPQVLRA